jgi:hypothetical protein
MEDVGGGSICMGWKVRDVWSDLEEDGWKVERP